MGSQGEQTEQETLEIMEEGQTSIQGKTKSLRVGNERTESNATEIEDMSEDDDLESMESYSEIDSEEDELMIIGEEEAESIEVQDISEAEDIEPMEVHSRTDSKEDKLTSKAPANHKSLEAEAVISERPEAKKATEKKSLPFNPAKIKEAAVTKSKGITPAGSKPTGVKKATSKKPATKRGKEPTVDDILAKTRKWLVSPTSYMIRNAETGCFGLSNRHREGERPEITIAHTEDCECLDVRLLHICQHVEKLVKQRLLARRSREAFVIATKIRRELDGPLPKAVRFPPLRRQQEQVFRRPKREVDAEEEIIHVVEVHNQQRLVEKWKSLEAYKTRRIWRDW
ncbi:hypothetical protein F5Y03DRAFT_83417 [Xylaria venustula]|nr:hypothetical protein F5Y03DRAFT_83417 [Xylaria venustula]